MQKITKDIVLFFFSSRRRHTRSKRDWSSDVCSSDLVYVQPAPVVQYGGVYYHGGYRHPYYYGDHGRRYYHSEWEHHHGHRSEERRVGKECKARWCGEV